MSHAVLPLTLLTALQLIGAEGLLVGVGGGVKGGGSHGCAWGEVSGDDIRVERVRRVQLRVQVVRQRVVHHEVRERRQPQLEAGPTHQDWSLKCLQSG
jgi:hypothetical protein